MDDARRLIAAFFDSIEAGLRLAAAEPELIRAKTGLGETPLHYLAVENQLDAVRALVELGSDVNNLNNCQGTPLSEAASLGYVDLVKLLTAGAKVNVDGQDDPALHRAAANDRSRSCEVLLAAGSDVNSQNDLDATDLHLAAEHDHPAVVAKLLCAGADPQLRGIFNETPLDVARRNGSAAAERELLAFVNG